VTANPELATFIIARRSQIDAVMSHRLGPAAPGAGSVETEVLRRFRSFAASALRRGDAPPPALDGLRPNQRRATALLGSWTDAAAEVAGDGGEVLRSALDPLLQRFRASMRQTHAGRRATGTPRTRRAVVAAIDRIADVFLAVDADSGHIADANPAAGSILGVARDALLGVEALSFVPEPLHDGWWTELDAVTEGAEPRQFASTLRDVEGREVPVVCSVTRFATRSLTLALVVARPL
jgi:PAS domain S-box-containing protein